MDALLTVFFLSGQMQIIIPLYETPKIEKCQIQTITPKYDLIQDEETLKKWLLQIKDKVAIDTETTGINPMQAKLVGFSLGLENGKACYVPLRHGTLQETTDLFSFSIFKRASTDWSGKGRFCRFSALPPLLAPEDPPPEEGCPYRWPFPFLYPHPPGSPAANRPHPQGTGSDQGSGGGYHRQAHPDIFQQQIRGRSATIW